MTPLTISVAMCTFNGEPFLSSQLETIAAQSRLPNELVVCDDRSSDRTIEILRQFAQRVSFTVRIEINPVNLGSTRNFEKCISLCRGNIVALADQDDVWYPHKLRTLEAAFHKSSDVVAAFSDADVIDDDSRSLGLRLWASFGLDRSNKNKFANGHALDVLCNHPVITGATLAFRREYFDVMRPIPAKQFHDAWISFLLATCGRFVPISEPLMQYRRHTGQQVGIGASDLRFSEQIPLAMKAGKNRRSEERERFEELYSALRERADTLPNARVAMKRVEGKLAHLRRRSRLPEPRMARVFDVLHEAVTGAYWHYSSGWKSIAKDLIVR
jgi:glycosyltransferase involved in cell wall biosynthesis